ncbi:ABC transporter permease [Caloranaerobacter ferrireducens]|uniref:ABC transporter permease n=1 Tax=Caloranaerobacter ferrireducens TaxID=1323370 RepID=UPI00084D9A73|nr:FtsX-like permease family protein [Caloranaerobacter ferrireducens]
MKKLNLKLLRSIKNSKGQFIAVTLVIIVGLTVYTALSMAAVNLESTINYYYDITNFADLYVQVVKAPEKAIDNLKKMKDIEFVEGRIVFDVPIKVRDKDERVKVRIISKPDEINGINSLYMMRGENIDNKYKDCLVIKQFADARKMKIGDILKPQISGKTYNLSIKGVVSSPEYIYLMENEQSFLPSPKKFGVMYVTKEFAQDSFGFRGNYNEIIIKAKKGVNLNNLKKKIENELDKYGVKRIITKDEQLSNWAVSEEIKGLRQSSSTIPLIFLGVAAIIMAVMLSRMVRAERTSIGVLKALGYTNIQLILHYTKYSLLVGFIGAIFGVILGTILSGYMAKMYIKFFNIPMLKMNFYYKYMVSAVVLSMIFCIIAGLWGGKKVLKILPAESMRPEPPKSGGRIFIDRVSVLWSRLTFTWKMVLRNIFRNKKRFIFITLGIALTYSVTFLPLSARDAFVSMFSTHYGEFQRMEYNISFSKPLNKKVIKDIKNIINVDHIEPKIEYPFEIEYGHKSKVVNIIGLQKDTRFYKFTNIDGDVISLKDRGIFLTEGLAKYLGVEVGDNVKIKNFIPDKEDVYLRVSGIIKQSLGINGYMNIDEMEEKLVDNNVITGVYLNSDDNVKSKLENMSNITSIQSLQDMKDVFKQFLDLTMYSVSLMTLFGGVLGFAIVYNSTVMSINERRLEFSSLRVMGFSKRDIYNMLSRENRVMTILGIIIGLPIGQYMIRMLEEVYSTEMYTMDVQTSLLTYIGAILLTMLFVTLAQLFTLRKINRLDFIEALKNRIS